jgi:hypothetical protein
MLLANATPGVVMQTKTRAQILSMLAILHALAGSAALHAWQRLKAYLQQVLGD